MSLLGAVAVCGWGVMLGLTLKRICSACFDAVYWATVSLTTVGYGDIYPVADLGRVVSMLSSFFGIAVVVLPAGIVTAEYLGSLKEGNCKDR